MANIIDLLGIPTEDFFSQHWMKHPVILHPKLPNIFQINESNIFDWFDQYGLEDDRFITFLEKDLNPQESRNRLKEFLKTANKQQIIQRSYKEAFVINDLATVYPFSAYCQELSNFCKAKISVNCYLVRPGAERYTLHHDRHHVFTVQVQGKKKWKLWPPSTNLPTFSYFGDAEETNEQPIEITTEAGDGLYIPNGWRHYADTLDLAIHFSFGIYILRWVDYLRDICEHTGAKQDSFRDHVPFDITENGVIYKNDSEIMKILLQKLEYETVLKYHNLGLSGEGSHVPSSIAGKTHKNKNLMTSRFET